MSDNIKIQKVTQELNMIGFPADICPMVIDYCFGSKYGRKLSTIVQPMVDNTHIHMHFDYVGPGEWRAVKKVFLIHRQMYWSYLDLIRRSIPFWFAPYAEGTTESPFHYSKDTISGKIHQLMAAVDWMRSVYINQEYLNDSYIYYMTLSDRNSYMSVPYVIAGFHLTEYSTMSVVPYAPDMHPANPFRPVELLRDNDPRLINALQNS